MADGDRNGQANGSPVDQAVHQLSPASLQQTQNGRLQFDLNQNGGANAHELLPTSRQAAQACKCLQLVISARFQWLTLHWIAET